MPNSLARAAKRKAPFAKDKKTKATLPVSELNNYSN